MRSNLFPYSIFLKIFLGIIFAIPLLFSSKAYADGSITTCGTTLSLAGTYTLSGDISYSGTGPCIIVTANNVVIDGSNHTVTVTGGNTSYAVVATSSTSNGGSAYGTTTIQNITFSGFGGGLINANGNTGANPNAGGAGGAVSINNVTTTSGIISSNGGNSAGTLGNGGGGVGGNISVTNSNLGSGSAISSNGGLATSAAGAFGGKGGNITIDSSITGSVSDYGGGSGSYSAAKNAGYGGSVIIRNNSTVGSISNYGGAGRGLASSGNAGSVTVSNSTVGSIASNGGNEPVYTLTSGLCGYGGSGATITISTSTVGSINGNGGTGGTCAGTTNGGVGGSGATISITNSTFSGTISTNGGAGGAKGPSGGTNANGGNAGTITFSGTNLDFTNTTSVSALLGAKGGTGASDGTGGTLNLSYSGSLTAPATTISALSHLIINAVDSGAFAGGLLPSSGLSPGPISSCGTLSSSGTYTLSGPVTGNCVVATSGIILAGGGYTLTGNVTANGNYPFTLSNITISGSATSSSDITLASSTRVAGSVSSAGALTINTNSSVTGSVDIVGTLAGDGTGILATTTIESGHTISATSVGFSQSILNHGTINGNITLNNSSVNFNSINGNVTLNGLSINSGTITGVVIMNGSASNSGTITGDATLNNSGTNSGTINGNATLNSFATNSGTITGTTIILNDSSSNSHILNGATSLNSSAINSGTINGSVSLNATSLNTGIITGAVTMNDSSSNSNTINGNATLNSSATNSGTINGDTTLNNSAVNSGTINGNATLNSSTANSGTITGNAYFNMLTAVSGTVSFSGSTAFGGIGIVNGNVYASSSAQINFWVFNDSSRNLGYVKGNVTFNNGSSNSSTGVISGSAIFNASSTNLGSVLFDANVYSPVTRPLLGTVSGQIIYHGYPGLYFNDSATGHGLAGKWDDIRNWWTDAGFTIHSPVVPTSGDNVYIYGNITASAITAVVNTAIFENISNNGINLYISGSAKDAALFNASSTNSGTIHGNATFMGNDTDSPGTVTGFVTRQYNTGTYSVVKDFTHNSVHWIIQAINGASVDLSQATYSLIFNSFQALNNGFFSAWNSLVSLGSSGNPNLVINSLVTESNAKWSPNISWGTNILCQYKIDGSDYVNADCSKNGSDIPRPTAGTHTMFFRSTDTKLDPTNDISEKSVIFTYDNTLPVSTDCSAPLDETRPFYYLTANVGNCLVTASTTLRGDDNGGGHFYLAGNITGSSTNVAFLNMNATGTISSFNNVSVSSSTLSGPVDVIGILSGDSSSRIGANGTTTVESGGEIAGGVFVGNVVNGSGGTIVSNISKPTTVAGNTTNRGVINGDFIFNGTSTNSGTVNGNVVLNGNSTNSGTITGNATLNGISTNTGTVNGNLTFGTLTSSSGAVNFYGLATFGGTGTVDGNIYDSTGTNRINYWVFNDLSANAGLTKGTAFFNGTSTNAGTINGNAHFSDSSLNAGYVTGNANVYYSVAPPISNSGNISGSITYHSYPNTESFNNATGDGNWNNPLNWFADATFAIPLGRIPSSNEKVVLFASTTLPSDRINNIFIGTSGVTLDGANHAVRGDISGNGSYGGHNAYSFNLANVTVIGTTSANGADGIPGINGGKGGSINIATSSTGIVAANGGDPEQNGGDAGDITIVYSYAIEDSVPILAKGGDSTGCGYGGSGGNVTLIDSSGYNIINVPGNDATTTIAQGGGCANPPSGSHGSTGQTHVVGTYHAASASSASSNSSHSTGGGSVISFLNNLGSLFLKPIQKFTNIENTDFGTTKLGNPLEGLTSPGTLKLGMPPFSLVPNISSFLFAPLPSSISKALKNATKLGDLLASAGVSTEQDLASIRQRPILLPPAKKDIPGLFIVRSWNKLVNSYVSSEAKASIVELVRVGPNDPLNISLVPLSSGKVTGKFEGKIISFAKSSGKQFSVSVFSPSTPGKYLLSTPSSPIPLVIEVTSPVAPSKPVMAEKKGWLSWLTDIFH